MAGAHRPDVTAIPLGRPSPDASSNQPERQGQRTRPRGALRRRASLLFGLAPGGACHAADVAARAVRSYRTLSPLPPAFFVRKTRKAVCFLWRFPWGRPRRTLSGAVSAWSPDFPPPEGDGRPADWRRTHSRARASGSRAGALLGQRVAVNHLGQRAVRLMLFADQDQPRVRRRPAPNPVGDGHWKWR